MFDATGSNTAPKIMTIGYEGAALSDFIETLIINDIRTLVDIRELPLSRKKGFSKTALGESLKLAGISYHHVRQLGDPKPGREAARAGKRKEFYRIFSEHMEQDASRAALRDLIPLVSNGGVCLLCFERYHHDCHRSMVADAFSKLTETNVVHLGVNHGCAK